MSSVVQYGGIGALEGSQDSVAAYRRELQARRDLFYAGIRETRRRPCSAAHRRGARSMRFSKSIRRWRPEPRPTSGSLSWALAEFLIARGRIGCVPGIDFGANGEGYIRFCFARDRAELTGALESMRSLFRYPAK